MLVEIKHRFTAEVLFSVEAAGMKAALEIAVGKGADLVGSNLRGADLRGANLRDADLRGADLRDADLVGSNLVGANLRGADLRDADLVGSNLVGANLRGACLIDAGQDSRGYRFVSWMKDGSPRVSAGCRDFTLEQARNHWIDRHKDDPALHAECLAKLDLIEAVAKERGWISEEELTA